MEKWWTLDFNPSTHFILLLNTDFEFNGYSKWEWFHLPKIIFPAKSIVMNMTFFDENDYEIFESKIPMGPFHPGFHASERTLDLPTGKLTATQIIVSPFFLVPPYYKTDFIITKDIQMNLDKLRKVTDVKFSFSDLNKNDLTHAPTGEFNQTTSKDKPFMARTSPPSEKTNIPRTNARTSSRQN